MPHSRPRQRTSGTAAVPAHRSRAGIVRSLLVGVVAGTVVLTAAAPAGAAPTPPPPNPSDEQIGQAQSAQDAAAAEVGRISALVAQAQSQLEGYAVQAEAAGAAYLAAEEALLEAQAEAERTAAELQAATEAVDAAMARIAGFSRDSYMSGNTLSTAAALLDAEGPADLIERAAMLDYVSANHLDVLGQLEVARVQQANADSAARAARDKTAEAEAAAAAAKATADQQLAAQRAAYDQVTAQKAAYEQQLQAAEVELLRLQGARDAYQAWQEQKAAEEAAAAAAARRAEEEAAAAAAAARAAARSQGSGSGSSAAASSGGSGPYVKPTSGRTSSCFGSRWGALHGGVDIAAPIGTPIYAAHSGVVARAGTATGFGYAVYIRGDDGAVTVYGHVNQYFVRAGERVVAGELIAEVGNRGQSTGPHLHFEVHPSGAMYGGQVDPVPWLRGRGVSISGC
ncbi:Murein DD-endopeptidase MepM and murein hydrolase activator NlpD, contain LysM domain [Geodermatophilus siccatus]|uniref:Murein DD-endopeptidase MepM and murein hydrolase activator NlpD, contain LysM domain n=1 Tax=Geodermatophilus siccatus TaxID=1137991 RepID=A0A1H0B9T3_9ACTN|nr:peptidoglycan DD-metalloendopeptidase family protein [Geodermatophilus siccatus]SDN42381.1 Murein DD-endopeptidase MepM and murein hydrolase activator NlpD, contain LysM domain [Geodermatophilus siccatus]